MRNTCVHISDFSVFLRVICNHFYAEIKKDDKKKENCHGNNL